MLDWQAIETGMERFAHLVVRNAMPVMWRRKSQYVEPAEAYLELDHGPPMPVGVDEVQRTVNAQQTAETIAVCGMREFVAYFKTYSIDQEPGLFAKHHIGMLAAALGHAVLRKPLLDAGLSVVGTEPIGDLDDMIDGRLWSISVLPVRMRAGFVFVPAGAPEQPFVDSVGLVFTGTKPDGSTVTTPEQTIPEP